jgi:hypothetical protein
MVTRDCGMGDTRNVYRILDGKPAEKTTLKSSVFVGE